MKRIHIIKSFRDSIYEKIWKPKGTNQDQKLMNQLRLLYPVSEKELMEMVEQYRKEQIQLLVVFALAFMMILTGIGIHMLLPKSPIVIERGDYGETENIETVYPKDQDPIDFTVQAKEYTREELELAFEEGFQWVRDHMLSANSSAAQVRSDLNFITEVSGGLTAEWISSNPDLIKEDGQVCNEDWEKDRKETVLVTLLLSYGSEVRQQELYFTIYGPDLSAGEELFRKIQNSIKKEEEKSRTEGSFTLPAIIEGVEIEHSQTGKQMTGIFILTSGIFILLYYKKSSKLKEKMEQRKKEVLEDYPSLVNQLVLYLGAGMNLKSAFDQISREYQEDRKEGRIPFRYAYQEIYVMMNQMKAGMSERKAYELYGSRIGESCYLKLMSLIVQNLQKGNAGLLKALSEEEEKAFLKRLERARKQGEEAGTRLLFPMLILLIVVMAIVMVPAVLQFQNYG